MKKIITFVLAAMIGLATTHAQVLMSEPHNNAPEETAIQNIESTLEISLSEVSLPAEIELGKYESQLKKNPDQTVAALLNILLGDLGVGHFYTGQTLRGVLDIVFCWTGIPAIIGLFEGFIWRCDDEEEWAARVERWNNN